MGVAVFTQFGKEVKKWLIEHEQDQNWLIDQVQDRTGLYFDRSYLYKILTGKLSTPGIMEAIREITGIGAVSNSTTNSIR